MATRHIVSRGRSLGIAEFRERFREKKIGLAVLLVRRDNRTKMLSSFRVLARQKQSVAVVKVDHLI